MVQLLVNRPDQYIGPRSRISQSIVIAILRFLFGQIPVSLTVDDGHIVQLNDAPTEVIIAPPTLWQVLLIMRDPSFHLPEAFVKGQWYVASGDLAKLIVYLHNQQGKKPKNSGIFGGLARSILHVRKQYLSPLLSREVRSHYNSDPDLFEIILGPSMVYSCAFFCQ